MAIFPKPTSGPDNFRFARRTLKLYLVSSGKPRLLPP